MKRLLWILLLIACIPMARAAEGGAPVLVFGAASLTNVVDELAKAYEAESHQAVKTSFAASSVLARQVEAGAKADIFFSADQEWMDYLQSRGLIDIKSRKALLTNQLVLIAPVANTIELKIAPAFPLAQALGGKRLATGDPDSVPVGKYAKSALTTLGVWSDVADRIVRADNVRTALLFVERGETPLGIVYTTDALIDKKVRVVDTFPSNSHAPIIYPIALTRTANAAAAGFVMYLSSPAAEAVFLRYGFGVQK
jgi:molybdate transport system substrate-binding protein